MVYSILQNNNTSIMMIINNISITLLEITISSAKPPFNSLCKAMARSPGRKRFSFSSDVTSKISPQT
jgi:hypothetical protein